MTLKHLALGILFVLISSASADYFGVTLRGDNSSYSWGIERQSQNISFSLSSFVDGSVSATKFHDRFLGAYQSSYTDVVENDIWLKERTSSLEGRYRSEENINLKSRIDNAHEVTFIKPSGTDVYTLSVYERWPVLLTANKNLLYSGRRINDWDVAANNRDFASSNMLYNHELVKDWRTVMVLDRMNATAQSTEEAIVLGDLMATRYLGYLVKANTTGIADLRYNHAGPIYDPKRSDYPPLQKGEERYYGAYSIRRLIEMRSPFDRYDDADDLSNSWLPCCNTSMNGTKQADQKGFGTDASAIFDCSC
jgi:hypothetical protein